MRIWPVAIAGVVGIASRRTPMRRRARGWPSLAAKVAASQRGAEDAFWSRVAGEGTPLVEDVSDPKGRLLVTFVYRARPDTRAVALYNAPGGIVAGREEHHRLRDGVSNRRRSDTKSRELAGAAAGQDRDDATSQLGGAGDRACRWLVAAGLKT